MIAQIKQKNSTNEETTLMIDKTPETGRKRNLSQLVLVDGKAEESGHKHKDSFASVDPSIATKYTSALGV